MVSEPEIVTAPAVEPVSLSEAKAHLRVDYSDDDSLIGAQISAARRMVEGFTRNRLITQTLRFTWNHFPPTLSLPVWPVQSVETLEYTDTDGSTQTLAASDYTLIKRKPREIGPAYSEVWPATRLHWNAVRVEVKAGHGDAGSDVPGDLLAAMKLILASLYEHRETVVIGATVSDMKGLTSARALMEPHVLWV